MIPLAMKSRQCLIDDIKCLESKLLHLQGRFEVIVDWIRSQYLDFSGLPEHIKVLLSEENNDCRLAEHVKVECDALGEFCDPNVSDDVDTDSRNKNSIVKVDDDILKGIESGPVSRLRIQLEKRKLACLEVSQNEKMHRNISDVPVTKTYEDSQSFPQLIVEDMKWENGRLIDENSTDSNEPSENVYPTFAYADVNQMDRSVGTRSKRVSKNGKYLQRNKANGLIIDAVHYKEMVDALPRDRLSCFVCNKNFATTTQRRRHEIQVHLTKEEQNKLRNQCSVFSDGTVATVKTTTDDIAVSGCDEGSANSESTMCDICKFPFKNIESHRLNHLPPDVITTVEGKRRPHYRCLKCGSLFSVKAKYLVHITRECKAEEILENSNYAQLTEKRRTEKNFLCNQCGQAFNRKHTLKVHIMAVHAKRKDFKCQFCEKSFTVEFVKNNHEKKHLGTSSVICDLCGFTFTCKQILKKHISGVHLNKRPFQCQLCDKSFKTSNARNYHVNTHGNPNGRKRGLNRDIDPVQAAAKRRNCSAWKNNRIQKVETGIASDGAAATYMGVGESQYGNL